MTRHYALLTVLGLAHGISDGAAGLLLGSLNHALALWQVGLLVLIYNALAFGGQPVAGFVVDQLHQPKLAAGVGLVTMSLALLAAALLWWTAQGRCYVMRIDTLGDN